MISATLSFHGLFTAYLLNEEVMLGRLYATEKLKMPLQNKIEWHTRAVKFLLHWNLLEILIREAISD